MDTAEMFSVYLPVVLAVVVVCLLVQYLRPSVLSASFLAQFPSKKGGILPLVPLVHAIISGVGCLVNCLFGVV